MSDMRDMYDEYEFEPLPIPVTRRVQARFTHADSLPPMDMSDETDEGLDCKSQMDEHEAHCEKP